MRRCFRVVFFGLLLLVTFTPTFADALPYNAIVYGPLTSTKDGVQNIEVGVVAFGKYDAAMVVLGYDSAYIDNLSSDVRALLSNQETGGDFWSFAQKFTLAPNDDVMTLNGITWKSLNALYGYGNVRRGVYTQSEAENARRDLLTILAGGSLGGGGGVSGDYITFSGNIRYYAGSGGVRYNWLCSDGTYLTNAYGNTMYGRLLSPMTVRIKLEGHLAEMVNGYSPDDYTYLCSINRVMSGDNIGNFYVYALNKDSVLSYGSYNQSAVIYDDAINGVTNVNIAKSVYLSSASFTFDGTTLTVSQSGSKIWGNIVNGTSLNIIRNDVYPIYFAIGGAEPEIPPSNWPTEPDVPAPTAPEVPTPNEPDLPVQPSTPTAPTLPDFPSNVIAPGTTYETFDIQAILDAMDEHCQHLQSAVYQGFSDYFDTFTPWLRDEFSTLRTFLREEDDWIVESISDEFMELRTYMKELAEWLADQMDFTITGGDYDDSTVVSWLKKIYYKLSGPSVNTKPVDPVGDPDGSWDWLKQLIDAILSALAGGAAALTGTLGELFEGIKDKFPFSIPWDIVAIVALLDAPPVTPAAVIEYDVFGAHVRYDIDLHFFDEQASVIRAMEDVLFCAFLLFKTDWLTGIFDGIGGFLGGKLKSTVKGV